MCVCVWGVEFKQVVLVRSCCSCFFCWGGGGGVVQDPRDLRFRDLVFV